MPVLKLIKHKAIHLHFPLTNHIAPNTSCDAFTMLKYIVHNLLLTNKAFITWILGFTGASIPLQMLLHDATGIQLYTLTSCIEASRFVACH